MANTKKVLEEEFTKAPQAKTAEDVNNQDSKTRLWQSLNTTYGNQMEESDKAYDKSISQMNNAMQSRGMQRSSYAAQVAANMYNDKNNARNRLGEALIADYQNRIGDIEAQDTANEWKEKEFAEGQRQFNESQALTREQNALNRAFTTSEREATQKYNTGEREATQAYQSGENALNRAFQTSEREASQAYSTSERLAQQLYNTSEREAQQAYQTEQAAKQQEFQAEQAALNREQEQAQFEVQQAFAEKQWEAQQDQWRQQFEYDKMSTDQKLAYETVINIIGQGNDPSDDLLARAGISRADVNAMKAQAKTASSGPARGNDDDNSTGEDDGTKSFISGLFGGSAKDKVKTDTNTTPSENGLFAQFKKDYLKG